MSEDKRYKVNERITSQELRVISSKGENVGVMPKFKALELARSEKLDLVEIGPKAVPPVAKILDFKKFLYEERKKQSAAKAHSKQTELKEFKFGPNIGANDLRLKIERARGFLKDKNRVRFTVNFVGRQQAYPQLGWEKINTALASLTEEGKAEEPPKMINTKTLTVMLLPK